jgi:hypothetical protein
VFGIAWQKQPPKGPKPIQLSLHVNLKSLDWKSENAKWLAYGEWGAFGG